MPTRQIHGFDAHIYFTPESRDRAQALRDKAFAELKTIPMRIGPLIDKKVGPHPLPMFQIQFSPGSLSEMILWLMANRNGLTVLVHQITGDDLRDHYDGALWMGEILELDDTQLDPSPIE